MLSVLVTFGCSSPTGSGAFGTVACAIPTGMKIPPKAPEIVILVRAQPHYRPT